MEERILTVTAAAEYLSVHPSTIYRHLKRKSFPAFRVGADWRLRASDLDAWIEKQVAANSAGEPPLMHRGKGMKVA
jgi:excisionase family DNA binding protein